MIEDTDTSNGGEDLSVEQAADLYVKASAAKEADPGQSEAPEQTEEGTPTDDELQASEDVSEEDDGETATEDQAEDGEDEPESEQGRFVADNAKVRLSDGTVTTIAELKSGSLKNADYTQKTQALSEQRKQFEAQSEATKQREAQLTQQAEYVSSLIQAIIPQAPEASLMDPASPNYDPVGYMQKKANFDAWQQHQTALSEFQQRTQQQRQAETQSEMQERAQAEWGKLSEKVPDLKDAAKAKAFGDKLLAHGKAYDFTEDELRSILPQDHRFALMARDAIKWRELQASKTKVEQKVANRPPVQRGGKRLNPSEAKARQASEAITQLRKTGSVDDAARAYLARKG